MSIEMDSNNLEQGHQTEVPETPETPELPPKFQGKSVAEIVQSYQNLESELGRARNEVGTVRRLADELLGLRRQAPEVRTNPEPPPKITTDQLFDNPTDAIVTVARRTAEETAARTEAKLEGMETYLQTESFKRDFPDYEQTMNDPGFQSWIRGSSLRQRLAAQAAGNDFDAARELFGLYKEVSASAPNTSNRTSATDPASVALARGGGSSAAGVANTSSGKKIYNRDELIQMKIHRPEEYERQWPEIYKAYQEKRVR